MVPVEGAVTAVTTRSGNVEVVQVDTSESEEVYGRVGLAEHESGLVTPAKSTHSDWPEAENCF
jgi:hypothetical protein